MSFSEQQSIHKFRFINLIQTARIIYVGERSETEPNANFIENENIDVVQAHANEHLCWATKNVLADRLLIT